MKKPNKNTETLISRQLSWRSVLLVSATLAAQAGATEAFMEPVLVTAPNSPLDPNLPTSTFSVTRSRLDAQSFINTEDALAYAPATTVRKRFIGDRNANLGGRSFGTTQPARGLVYVDGYLISNFLGRFDAPRWSIVAPREVARVDVLYGPFSALYPGNAIGTTVEVTTRMPDTLEASAGLEVHHQTHEDYGLQTDARNHQQSAYVANQWGRLSLAVGLNRIAYESQPMGYAVAQPAAGGVAGLPLAGGAVIDAGPTGTGRVIVGATGLQKGRQEQAKIKLGLAFTPTLEGDVLYARWRNDYSVSNRTLLHDTASGDEIWHVGGVTPVNIGGNRYHMPNMVPQAGVEEHQQAGARLRTRNKTGWNQVVQLSTYRVLTNSVREAGVSDPLATAAPGSVAVGDGTGWNTIDLRSSYTPRSGESHALTFGYHRSRYILRNRVFTLSDWHDAATRQAESASYDGKTETVALFVQDAWHFHPDWVATLGVRAERFRAWNGAQFDSRATSDPRVVYNDRRESALSPKFSLTHILENEWMVRASVARGVRFPTVSELFQGARSGTSIIRNDPAMRPEVNDAKELSFIHETDLGSLRLSLFEDDVRDAIFQQQQTVGAVTVTTVQNIERVRTRGIEAAFQGRDVLMDGFDLQASVAFAHAKTLRNPAFPASEGKDWPRVPRMRASVLGSYRTGPWTGSLGLRHEGRQYGTLDNSDIRRNTVGAVSSFTVINAKLGYELASKTGHRGRFALGIDNLTDRRYYAGPHPYPGRTVYAEAHFSY